MTACDRCGESNHDDARFCGTCGVAMPTTGGLESLLIDPPPSVVDPTAVVGSSDAIPPSSEQVAAPTFGEMRTAGTSPPVADGAATVPRDDRSADVAAQVPAAPTAARPAADAADRTGEYIDPVHVAPVRTSRSASIFVALIAVAAVAVIGGIFILIGSDPEAETARTDEEATSNAEPDPVEDASPVGTAVATAVTSSVEPPPETATAPTVAAETVAPGTVDVEIETPPTEPVAPTAAPPTRGPGDLGLDQPILDEACDGRYITFVGSAVGDRPYDSVVDELLESYPGTNYIWTKACPSLRQEFSDGADIYGVVYGPYPTQDEACSARAFGPADAYVRRISTTDPPGHTVGC